MYTKDCLLVANTFPVFKKAIIDNEKGVYFSNELSFIRKDVYDSTSEYLFDFNMALNQFIANCYNDKDSFFIEHEINSSANFRFYEVDNGYYLYLLKTEFYFIFLNYGKITDMESVHKIPHFKNNDSLSRCIKKEGKFFAITNTYDSFLSFADINGIKPNLNANELYYESFINSIYETDLLPSIGEVKGTIDIFHSKEKGIFKGFNYIVLEDVVNDIIIILDYYETVFKV